jgi:hypothetical protein
MWPDPGNVRGREAIPQEAIPEVQAPRRRRRGATTFVGTRDYTPPERLRLLIHATRRAIRDTADMELAVANALIQGGVAVRRLNAQKVADLGRFRDGTRSLECVALIH